MRRLDLFESADSARACAQKSWPGEGRQGGKARVGGKGPLAPTLKPGVSQRGRIPCGAWRV